MSGQTFSSPTGIRPLNRTSGFLHDPAEFVLCSQVPRRVARPCPPSSEECEISSQPRFIAPGRWLVSSQGGDEVSIQSTGDSTKHPPKNGKPSLFVELKSNPVLPKKTAPIEVHPFFNGKLEGKRQKGWTTARIEVHT